MIHFFQTFSKNTETPYTQALRELGVEHRMIAGEVKLSYRHRTQLLLLGLPKLGSFAARAAWQSMAQSDPLPDAVVVASDVEALACALVRGALRRKTRIYYGPFILTERKSALLNHVRRAYFAQLIGHIDCAVCHSSLELKRYRSLFPKSANKFVMLPYGQYFKGFDEPRTFQDPSSSPALSAGRSGRDYPTLFEAFRDAGYPLRVICDYGAQLERCVSAPNISVLRDCYGDAYLRELRQAGMVIIPLAVNDISAGQMVLVQAMAYGKPIIATQAPTVEEYLTHEVNALLVPPRDSTAIRAAVDRLRTDRALASRLAENAYATYLDKHTVKVVVRNLVNLISAGNA